RADGWAGGEDESKTRWHEGSGGGRRMLDAEESRAVQKPVHRRTIEAARLATEAVGFRDSGQQLQLRFLREPAKGAVADAVARLVPSAGLEMLRDDAQHLLSHVVSVDGMDVQSIEKRRRWRDALR